MPPPPAVSSPFQRDEPVSRSRKWMLVLWSFLALGTTSLAVMSILFPPPVGDMVSAAVTVLMTLVISFILQIILLVLMWKAARAARQCRRQRNFDTMAAAVRAQRPFWMMVSIGTALSCLSMVATGFLLQGRLAGLEDLVRAWEEKQKQQQPPAPPPAQP